MRLMTSASTGLMEMSVYEVLDTDHHGHPLREADMQVSRETSWSSKWVLVLF